MIGVLPMSAWNGHDFDVHPFRAVFLCAHCSVRYRDWDLGPCPVTEES